ncbi:hypothetical protein [Streptomyces chromofuscus]|uniref:Lipoprotein n=1 Tax=Streptomyces chromofuscus TaxID=42881 RepID=A0A7M2T752_STRCW|nr:hypothetical protein [Streptomyces chromofuscus]QOV44537.1 hypothetical protein IPT68_00280 [Streptomyces chromofuscus]GGT42559.1 hypothetical protein GCM10010254_72650 [Streptomyces chromofuscus]
MRIRVVRVTVSAAMATALLLLAGCSSGNPSDEVSGNPASGTTTKERQAGPEDAALTKAVQAYTTAYFDADAPAALGIMSQRCRTVAAHEAEHAGEEGRAGYEAALADAAEKYGSRDATEVTVDELSGDRARVSYKIEGLPEFDQQGQPWIREQNAWKYDAC